jgi:IclR family acetate operon transcriptional repressor
MRVVKSAIERSLDVLALLADDAQSMTLGQIAEALEMPKSATHRLLCTLCELGWAEQDGATGFYRLTLRLAVVGQRLLMGTRIPDVCQPVLDELARDTESLVRMAIVEGDGLTWIAQAQGARTGLIYQPEVVARVPLHITANGKAWLSMLPKPLALRLVRDSRAASPNKAGPKVIRNDESFAKALEETRTRGWAMALQEAEEGVAAIAAPIRTSNDLAVGTVSIAGPVHRFSEARVEVLVSRLLNAANELGILWPLRNTTKRVEEAVVRPG